MTDDLRLSPGTELAIVRFKGRETAEYAYGRMRERAGDAPWTHEVALLEHHHNDHIELFGTVAGHYVTADETDHISQKGAAVGGIIGALLGVPLGPPAFAAGLVAGGTVGALVWKPSDSAPEPHALVDRLRDAVPKGSSAIVLLAAAAHVDDMLTAIGDEDGETARTVLTQAELDSIEQAVRDAPPASPGPEEQGQST